MATKDKRIKLVPRVRMDNGGEVTFWEVIEVTNSIIPKPGDMLEEGKVAAFCNAEDWGVTIVKAR